MYCWHCLSSQGIIAAAPVHVFEKVELTFTATGKFSNPYTDVEVWVDLKGPHFNKRCYGFWDGGGTFRVRILALEPGTWSWVSGSNPSDPGLTGKKGSFQAIAWTEAEKQQNPKSPRHSSGNTQWACTSVE